MASNTILWLLSNATAGISQLENDFLGIGSPFAASGIRSASQSVFQRRSDSKGFYGRSWQGGVEIDGVEGRRNQGRIVGEWKNYGGCRTIGHNAHSETDFGSNGKLKQAIGFLLKVADMSLDVGSSFNQEQNINWTNAGGYAVDHILGFASSDSVLASALGSGRSIDGKGGGVSGFDLQTSRQSQQGGQRCKIQEFHFRDLEDSIESGWEAFFELLFEERKARS